MRMLQACLQEKGAGGMKRWIASALLAALLVTLFAGCADGGGKAADDHPYSMFTQNTFVTFAPSDTGYYFQAGSMLYYMDAASMEPVPVCAKPNCLHDAEPDDEKREQCNAYFESGTWAHTSWYDGNLYILNNVRAQKADSQWPTRVWQVECVSPDGSRRRTVWQVGEHVMIEAMLIHRGVLYLARGAYDEKGNINSGIWALSLKDAGAKPECILETTNALSKNTVTGLNAYGDCLYFTRPETPDSERVLCILNTKTRELTTVPSPAEGYVPVYAAFFGGKVLLMCRKEVPTGDTGSVDSYPQLLYRCDPDGSRPELVREGLGQYSGDDKYIYMSENAGSEAMEYPAVRIFDGEMREVDRVDLRQIEGWQSIVKITQSITLRDKGMIEIGMRSADDRFDGFFWFDKSEIGSGQITLHPFFTTDYGIGRLNASGSSTPAPAVTTAAVTTSAAAAAPTAAVTTRAMTVPVRPDASYHKVGPIDVEDLGIDLGGAAVEFLCSVPEENFAERLRAWEKAAEYIGEAYHGDVTLTPLTFIDAVQTIRTRQAAGEAPDVLSVANIGSGKLAAMVRKGQIIPLDGYIPDCMPRSYTRVDARLYENVRFGGQAYAILSLSDALFPRQTLYYDKSMTDAAGITVGDWTRMSDNWETFYRMRAWLDENRPELHDVPVAAVNIDWADEGCFDRLSPADSFAAAQYPGWEAAARADSVTEAILIYMEPEMLDYLKSIRQLKLDRILPEDWTFWPREEQKESYYGAEGCVFRSEPGEESENLAVSFQSKAFCAPGTAAGAALVVSADSEAPEAACRLIEILNCDKYAGTCLRLGAEGVHWTMNADGQAEIVTDLGMWNDAALGDVTNCVVPVSAAPDFAVQLEAVMANAVYSENLGFRLDPFSDDYPLRKEKGNPSLFTDSSGTWNLNWLPYLGMGTGKTIRQSLGEGRSVAVGQDIHVGYLLDGSLTEEELESLFVRARAGLPTPVLNEYQRQLDAWRAGR